MFEEHAPVLGAVLAEQDARSVRCADSAHPRCLDRTGLAEVVPKEIDDHSIQLGPESVLRLEEARRRNAPLEWIPEKHLPASLGHSFETHRLEEPGGQKPLGPRQVMIGRRHESGAPLTPRGLPNRLDQLPARPQTGRLLHDVQTRKRQDPLAQRTPRGKFDRDSVGETDDLTVKEGHRDYRPCGQKAHEERLPAGGASIDLGRFIHVTAGQDERLVLSLHGRILSITVTPYIVDAAPLESNPCPRTSPSGDVA
ncbi:MAG: hypothetical protein NTY63_05200 [Candidatus Bipolaricaulota bacterium]|nr:hypothetical protein [Candidatus Bipolaricaulota bacterium]